MTTEIERLKEEAEDRRCGDMESADRWERYARGLEAEVKRLRGEPKASDVVFIRCTKHHTVMQFNSSEHNGGECGACIEQQAKEAGARSAFEVAHPMNNKLSLSDYVHYGLVEWRKRREEPKK